MLSFLKTFHLIYTLTLGFYSTEAESFTHQYAPGGRYWYEINNFFEPCLELEVQTPKKLFFIGGKFINRSQLIEKLPFTPVEALYYTDFGMKYKNVTIGYSHFCRHPIATQETYNIRLNSRFSGHNKWYVTITNRGQ